MEERWQTRFEVWIKENGTFKMWDGAFEREEAIKRCDKLSERYDTDGYVTPWDERNNRIHETWAPSSYVPDVFVEIPQSCIDEFERVGLLPPIEKK